MHFNGVSMPSAESSIDSYYYTVLALATADGCRSASQDVTVSVSPAPYQFGYEVEWHHYALCKPFICIVCNITNYFKGYTNPTD
jgi:hypothetical protein